MSIESLPIVDQAAMPREVREGTKEQKQAYAAALGFERMLVAQLTKSIAKDATGEGDGTDQESKDSGASMYSDMISSSLADAIAAKGGLGLGADLYRSLGSAAK